MQREAKRAHDRLIPGRHSRLRQIQVVVGVLVIAISAAFNMALAASAERAPVLRVLKLRYHEANHPHRDVAGEFRLLSDFAHHAGLDLQWLDAVQPADLEGRLARGEADLMVADGEPDGHPDGVHSSLSMGTYDYVVVGNDSLTAADPLALGGLRVAISLASPLWSYLTALEQTVEGLAVVVLPDAATRAEILRGIEESQYDAAVISVRAKADPLAGHPGIKRLFTLSADIPAVWQFSPHNDALRVQLNSWLRRHHAGTAAPQQAYGDLDTIRERHVLRVITRTDPHNYYLRGGRRVGFEYELVRQFSGVHRLAVEFKVANSDEQALDWLRNGIGDVASLRLNADRVVADPALTLSREYFHSAPVIVSARSRPPLDAQHLDGKRVAVVEGSVEHRTLAELVTTGAGLEPVVLPPETALPRIAEGIIAGRYAAAIVDAHAYAAVRDAYPALQAGASVASAYRYAWTVRSSDAHLGLAIDDFLRERFRRKTYNVLARRYFDSPLLDTVTRAGKLSPYDELVRRHADAFDFDWRLIVAQMYQESKFDPFAESAAGARGLMQMLPATALSVGVTDPFDPEAGIRGGITYLDRLRRRFDDTLSPRERTWFALAAYNIGFHRVELARKKARSSGRDPDRWFGHVEQVMRDMAQTNACGCAQTVIYVRGIRSLYATYSHLQRSFAARDTAPVIRPQS